MMKTASTLTDRFTMSSTPSSPKFRKTRSSNEKRPEKMNILHTSNSGTGHNVGPRISTHQTFPAASSIVSVGSTISNVTSKNGASTPNQQSIVMHHSNNAFIGVRTARTISSRMNLKKLSPRRQLKRIKARRSTTSTSSSSTSSSSKKKRVSRRHSTTSAMPTIPQNSNHSKSSTKVIPSYTDHGGSRPGMHDLFRNGTSKTFDSSDSATSPVTSEKKNNSCNDDESSDSRPDMAKLESLVKVPNVVVCNDEDGSGHVQRRRLSCPSYTTATTEDEDNFMTESEITFDAKVRFNMALSFLEKAQTRNNAEDLKTAKETLLKCLVARKYLDGPNHISLLEVYEKLLDCCIKSAPPAPSHGDETNLAMAAPLERRVQQRRASFTATAPSSTAKSKHLADRKKHFKERMNFVESALLVVIHNSRSIDPAVRAKLLAHRAECTMVLESGTNMEGVYNCAYVDLKRALALQRLWRDNYSGGCTQQELDESNALSTRLSSLLVQLGRTCYFSNHRDWAKDVLSHVVERLSSSTDTTVLDQDQVEAHFLLGWIAERAKDFKTAQIHHEIALDRKRELLHAAEQEKRRRQDSGESSSDNNKRPDKQRLPDLATILRHLGSVKVSLNPTSTESAIESYGEAIQLLVRDIDERCYTKEAYKASGVSCNVEEVGEAIDSKLEELLSTVGLLDGIFNKNEELSAKYLEVLRSILSSLGPHATIMDAKSSHCRFVRAFLRSFCSTTLLVTKSCIEGGRHDRAKDHFANAVDLFRRNTSLTLLPFSQGTDADDGVTSLIALLLKQYGDLVRTHFDNVPKAQNIYLNAVELLSSGRLPINEDESSDDLQGNLEACHERLDKDIAEPGEEMRASDEDDSTPDVVFSFTKTDFLTMVTDMGYGFLLTERDMPTTAFLCLEHVIAQALEELSCDNNADTDKPVANEANLHCLVRAKFGLSRAYVKVKCLEQATSILKEVIETTNTVCQSKDPLGTSYMWNELGNVRMMTVNFEEAAKCYAVSADLKEEVLGQDDACVLETRVNHAMALAKMGSTEEALSTLLDVLELQRNLRDDQGSKVARTLEALSRIYRTQRDFTSAISFMEEALTVTAQQRECVSSPLHEVSNILFLADLYMKQADYTRAEVVVERASSIITNLELPSCHQFVVKCQGLVDTLATKVKKGQQTPDQAIDSSDSDGSRLVKLWRQSS